MENFERWKQDFVTVSKITAEIFGLEYGDIRANHMVRQDNAPISDEAIDDWKIILNTSKDVNDVLESIT